MTITHRTVQRYLDKIAAKRPTFDAAKAEIFKHLKEKGWEIQERLKVPHATSSDGRFRLWFKAQAVYMSFSDDPGGLSRNMGDARSMHIDIRDESGPSFLADVARWEKILKEDR